MHWLAIIIWITHVAATSAAAADLPGVASVGGKGVPQAVVWLAVDQPPAFTQGSKVILDQRNLRFTPQVLVVRVGTTVDFPNNDKVFHNVFSFRDGKKFDLGMYPLGTTKSIVFDRPGLARLFCNIHPKMAAYVMAVDTPFYAVSGQQGAFTIPAVPPGRYTYHAWRAGAQALSGSVTVDAAASLEIEW